LSRIGQTLAATPHLPNIIGSSVGRGNKMNSFRCVRAAVAAMVFGFGSSLASAGSLNINFGVADATQREGFQALVNDFRASNPDVDVHLTLVDLAGFRKTLPESLAGDAAPDVFNW